MLKLESSYNLIDWWDKVVFYDFANFKGRATRCEHWYFVLANLVLIFPFYFFTTIGVMHDNEVTANLGFFSYASIFCFTFLPALALLVRRLHDINKSGWNLFIILIPIVGIIILLVWLFTDSNKFDNNYGPDPMRQFDPVFDFEQVVTT